MKPFDLDTYWRDTRAPLITRSGHHASIKSIDPDSSLPVEFYKKTHRQRMDDWVDSANAAYKVYKTYKVMRDGRAKIRTISPDDLCFWEPGDFYVYRD